MDRETHQLILGSLVSINVCSIISKVPYLLQNTKIISKFYLIDTKPPTATIFSEQNYTSAKKIAIDITFSEACTGKGGFRCVNSSNCDVSGFLTYALPIHELVIQEYSYYYHEKCKI